jgi:cytochrome b subunit of formate dehydrogenase
MSSQSITAIIRQHSKLKTSLYFLLISCAVLLLVSGVMGVAPYWLALIQFFSTGSISVLEFIANDQQIIKFIFSGFVIYLSQLSIMFTLHLYRLNLGKPSNKNTV